MMRVEFRSAAAGDLAQVTAEPLPHRIKAISALIEGRVVGIGGLGFRPDGTVIAFAHLTDELRRFPVAVHRAGRLGMRLIRSSGVQQVVAEAQPGNAAAERWLLRFGFRRVEIGDHVAFVWERSRDVAAP